MVRIFLFKQARIAQYLFFIPVREMAPPADVMLDFVNNNAVHYTEKNYRPNRLSVRTTVMNLALTIIITL